MLLGIVSVKQFRLVLFLACFNLLASFGNCKCATAEDLDHCKLHTIIQEGDVDKFHQFLSETFSGDVNTANSKKITPLMVASQHGARAIVDYLLYDDRLVINATNRVGENAIHFATVNGHAGIAQTLLDVARTKLEPNFVKSMLEAPHNTTKRTPLFYTALSKAPDTFLIATMLIKEDDAAIVFRDFEDLQPVHLAMMNKRLDIVSLLLEKNSDLASSPCCGREVAKTVTHLAAEYNLTDFTAHPLFNVSHLDFQSQNVACYAAANGSLQFAQKLPADLLNSGNCVYYGPGNKKVVGTPLQTAAYHRRKAYVDFLLSKLQSVEQLVNTNGSGSPLHAMALAPSSDSATDKAILTAIFNENPETLNSNDVEGLTPFLVAVKSSSIDVADSLRKLGASVTVKDPKGYSALHLANDVETLDYLLKLPVFHNNLDLQTAEGGLTPLHVAVLEKKPFALLNFMLAENTNKSHGNMFGEGIAHLAVEANNAKLLDAFLAQKQFSAFSVRDKRNRTALLSAIESGRVEIASKMIGNKRHFGPDKLRSESLPDTGDFAIHLAVRLNQSEIVRALLKEDPTMAVLVNAKSKQTPIHVAVAYGRWDTARSLLKAVSEAEMRSAIGLKDWQNRTVLHLLATRTPCEDEVQLEKELLVPYFNGTTSTDDSEDELGETALEIAVKRNCINFVKLFLQSNWSDCSRRNRNGHTLVDVAKRHGYGQLVDAIVEARNCSIEQEVYTTTPKIIQSSKTFQKILGQCDIRLPLIPNGEVVGEQGISGYWLGSKVKFRCNPGYVVRGASILECATTGRWHIKGHCEQANSPLEPLGSITTITKEPYTLPTLLTNSEKCDMRLPLIENGEAIVELFSSWHWLGTKVLFRCHAGYVVRGSNTIECTTGGRWEVQGHCEHSDTTVEPLRGIRSTKEAFITSTFENEHLTTSEACDIRLPVIENSEAVVEPGFPRYSLGSIVQFRCHAGYQVRGSNIIECAVGGRWHIRGHCEEASSTVDPFARITLTKETYALATFENEILSRPKGPVPSVIELFKVIPATAKPTLAITAQCCRCEPETTEEPDNTTARTKASTSPINESEESTHSNFTDEQQTTSTVEPFTPSTVEPVKTTPHASDLILPAIENAELKPVESSQPSAYFFACNPGYIVRGSNIIERIGKNVWLVKGYCEIATAVKCKEPPVIEHATFLNDPVPSSSNVGSNLGFACKPGYLLQGSNTIQCDTIGQWRVNGFCLTRSISREKLEELLNASETGNLGFIKAILAGASKEQLLNESLWKNVRNNPNWDTPLHRAAMRDQVEAVKILWPAMKEAVVFQNRNKDTPIHAAARHNSTRVVDFFAAEERSLLDTKEGVYGRTPLHQAASRGFLEMVRRLVTRHNANVYSRSNETSDKANLPIHLAAASGHLLVVDFLLERYPDLADAQNREGDLPIHSAALGGQNDVVEYLIKHRGVNVDSRTKQGRTPLHQAVAHVELVSLLVTKYRANVYAKSNDEFQSMPIHLAAYNGYLPTVDLLLDVAPELVNARDGQGSRPVHCAALGGQTEVVNYLILRRGVNVNTREDKFGRTILHLAASAGNYLELVNLLIIKHNADVNAKSTRSDNEVQPIHLAALSGRFATVRYLVSMNPKLAEAKDANGRTALQYAQLGGSANEASQLSIWLSQNMKVHGDLQLQLGQAAEDGDVNHVRILLQAGVLDVNWIDDKPYQSARCYPVEGGTALHRATACKRLTMFEVVKLLLDYGGRVDAKEWLYDRTPLMLASENGDLDTVRLLLDRGANLALRNRAGATPLFSAAAKGHFQTVRLLIDRGGNLDVKGTDSGSTPLMEAAGNGHLQVAQLLLDRGADFNAKNARNKTAKAIAREAGHVEITQLLQIHGA